MEWGNCVKRLAEYCDSVLNLKNATLSDEYYYSSLPLCVIDAVFSIGVKYEGTRRTVIRYCDYFHLQRLRADRAIIPSVSAQESVSKFLRKMNSLGVQRFTEEVFSNRQRTSTRNGILKSEATLLFARILSKYGIDYFQDVPKIITDKGFENDIKNMPGQRSGISLGYFFMLAGSEDFIKPDRHIRDFIKDATGKRVDEGSAQKLLSESCIMLNTIHRQLTPRLLDNTIWKYQRGHSKINRNKTSGSNRGMHGTQLHSQPKDKGVSKKHAGIIKLASSFSVAWEHLEHVGELFLNTNAGTQFKATSGITRDRRLVIRFVQKNREYGRAYDCCWGHYLNCYCTRIGMYCSALDKHVKR